MYGSHHSGTQDDLWALVETLRDATGEYGNPGVNQQSQSAMFGKLEVVDGFEGLAGIRSTISHWQHCLKIGHPEFSFGKEQYLTWLVTSHSFPLFLSRFYPQNDICLLNKSPEQDVDILLISNLMATQINPLMFETARGQDEQQPLGPWLSSRKL